MPTPWSAMAFSIGEYKPVMKALGTGQHEDRTVKSISEETGITKGEVEKALRWFFDNGLAQKRTAKDGTYWSLTKEGWRVYQSI